MNVLWAVLGTILLLVVAVVSFAADGDTIYNSRGQGIQVYAPNFFQNISSAAQQVNLEKTKIFRMDSTVDCSMYLTPTTSTSGAIAYRILADTPVTVGRGYGIWYVTFNGCSGVYSSMRSDWTGD